MTTKAIIKVDNLVKSFKDKEVLKGINLEVPQGEIFALLGSNGAGKTTMINILTGISKPDRGTAYLDGIDVVKNPQQVHQIISLTGQFAAVDEILTGQENLELIARLRHLPNPEKIAQEMLANVSLSDVANKQVGQYSGGMRRRIDIAMSLIGAPEIIFLDEPTTGLDPEARIEIYDLIAKLRDQGTTIFLTTQYLEEAEKLANQIAILHEGKIVVQGSFQELKALFPKPKVEYVEKQPTLEDIFLNIVQRKEK